MSAAGAEDDPAPVAVDARFGGGTIFVTTDRDCIGDETAVVVLDVPGARALALRAHEARALAAALLEQTEAAERIGRGTR